MQQPAGPAVAGLAHLNLRHRTAAPTPLITCPEDAVALQFCGEGQDKPGLAHQIQQPRMFRKSLTATQDLLLHLIEQHPGNAAMQCNYGSSWQQCILWPGPARPAAAAGPAGSVHLASPGQVPHR